MIRKLMKFTVSAAILATTIQAAPAFAAPGNTPVTQGQIDATKGQIEDFETKMQQLDNRISMAMEKSQNLADQINSQQTKIKQTEADIESAKKDLEAHKKVYSERLKSIQAEGNSSIVTYAEVLFSSNNLSELLTRFTAISQIMESDTDLLNGLNEKQQALKDAEDKLHTELQSLEDNKAALAAEQKQIEADKQEIQKELATAQTKLDSQQDQLAEQKEAERQAQLAQQRAQQELEQQRAQQQALQQPTSTTKASGQKQITPVKSVGTPTGSASEVIAYAKQFLGVPYVWGGSTPSGFDCSGLTSYVFRAVGINLPRRAMDQQDVGLRISPSQVQPGDLVFRGNPAYHVGIYIGGGKYIHAPQTGDVVKIATYNPSAFSSAARVLR